MYLIQPNDVAVLSTLRPARRNLLMVTHRLEFLPHSSNAQFHHAHALNKAMHNAATRLHRGGMQIIGCVSWGTGRGADARERIRHQHHLVRASQEGIRRGRRTQGNDNGGLYGSEEDGRRCNLYCRQRREHIQALKGHRMIVIGNDLFVVGVYQVGRSRIAVIDAGACLNAAIAPGRSTSGIAPLVLERDGWLECYRRLPSGIGGIKFEDTILSGEGDIEGCLIQFDPFCLGPFLFLLFVSLPCPSPCLRCLFWKMEEYSRPWLLECSSGLDPRLMLMTIIFGY